MDDKKGQAPTPEELFDHCMTLVGISVKGLEEAHAIRDEVNRTLKNVGKSHQDALGAVTALSVKVGEQGAQLHSMYGPESIKTAAIQSRKAATDFEYKTGQLFESIKKQASGTMPVFWLRTMGAAMVGSVAMLIVFGVLKWMTPGLDEISTRRAELDKINASIDALSGKIIDYDGGKWIRVNKDVPAQNLCQHGATCQDYYERIR